jgi:CRISPR-associated protein Csb1
VSDLLTKFDDYLKDDGAAALVIREYLLPAEGADGVVFPATFAAGDGFPGGYNVDGDPTGSNICLVDSVGSQANRVEPLFATEKYKTLVPQIVVKAGEKQVNLLEAGHRAGDAIVRCSELKEVFREAFKSLLSGNAEPLAKIAPTSLVFGVWDSRDTQAKLPRLVASTIRAYDVRRLTRSAVYVPPVKYVDEGLLEEPTDLRDAEGKVKGKHPFAQRGFVHNPASGSHGGVIATGGIRRDATLGLAALRLLPAGEDKQRTQALQRYILGIALTAFTYSPGGYLRQGCLLVLDPDKQREFSEVYANGKRNPVAVTHDAALSYAKATAEAFGVREDQKVAFDPELAKNDIAGDGKAKKGKKAK